MTEREHLLSMLKRAGCDVVEGKDDQRYDRDPTDITVYTDYPSPPGYYLIFTFDETGKLKTANIGC